MAKTPEKAEKVDVFFVKSKVRDYIKNKGCNTSGGVLDGGALNQYIQWYIDKAVERAQANGRKTVKARDL